MTINPIPTVYPYNTVEWQTGEIFNLTQGADCLVNIAKTHDIESAILEVVPDDPVKQQQVRNEYARWIYRET